MADYDRARSFIERYVIARAGLFRVEHEQEDLWACTQMAKSAYRMIANVSTDAEPPDPLANQATQGGMIPGNQQVLTPHGWRSAAAGAGQPRPGTDPSGLWPNLTPAEAQKAQQLMQQRLTKPEALVTLAKPMVPSSVVDRWIKSALNLGKAKYGKSSWI